MVQHGIEAQMSQGSGWEKGRCIFTRGSPISRFCLGSSFVRSAVSANSFMHGSTRPPRTKSLIELRHARTRRRRRRTEVSPLAGKEGEVTVNVSGSPKGTLSAFRSNKRCSEQNEMAVKTGIILISITYAPKSRSLPQALSV